MALLLAVSSGLGSRLWICYTCVILEPRLRGHGYLWHVPVMVNHFHGHPKSLVASCQLASYWPKQVMCPSQNQRVRRNYLPAMKPWQGWGCMLPPPQGEEIIGTNNSVYQSTLHYIIHQMCSNFSLYSHYIIMVVWLPYNILHSLVRISRTNSQN